MRFFMVALFACGCGSGRLEPNEYTGCGADENWRTFDDRETAGTVTVSDALGPVLSEPTGTVPAATRPILKWTRGLNDPGTPDGDVPHDGPSCNNCCPQWNLGGLTTLHVPPISGDVYDLQILDGATMLWRVITTLQEWTPPASS